MFLFESFKKTLIWKKKIVFFKSMVGAGYPCSIDFKSILCQKSTYTLMYNEITSISMPQI